MMIHLGDCAETFKDCNESSIKNRYILFTLCQILMSKILNKKVIKIGRMAGQYAKPRSSPTQIVNGETINSFFGDNVNSIEATAEDRAPNPDKLMKGYYKSVTTYHTIKKLLNNDFYSIAPDVLESQFREQTNIDKEDSEYEDFLATVKDCLDDQVDTDDLYVSHEGLLLEYESKMTRLCRSSKDEFEKYYNCSAHYMWIGERTNQIDHAHVEYFRGIKNPIGIKVGPKVVPEEMVKTFEFLNPNNELGKVTAILRFGASNVAEKLPPLIEAVKKNGINIVWVCDAAHGNTYVNDCSFKVRNVETILEELVLVHNILKKNDQVFGGIHLE